MVLCKRCGKVYTDEESGICITCQAEILTTNA